MLKKYALAFSLLIITTNSFADGDPVAGKGKTSLCTACHGPEGISTTPTWPNLAGQHAEYISKQLHDYKTGERTDPQMAPMAATLSAQDIEDVSAYYASLGTARGEALPEKIIDGETIYRAGNSKTGLSACMACHGPSGTGNPAANYPSLSGQHAAYTAATLKAFKAETRANDDKNVMRIIAGKMTNEEIEAVSNYLQGLH